MTSPLQFALAGFTDPETGLMGGPLQRWAPQTPWVPGKIEIRDKYLCWDPTAIPREVRPEGMLDRFIKIRSDEDVLRFAKMYGVLLLCPRHSLPCTHNAPSYGLTTKIDYSKYCRPSEREPLERWHYFVAYINALLQIAVRLREGEPAGPRFLESLLMKHRDSEGSFPEHIIHLIDYLARNAEQARFYFSHWLNEMLSLAGVSLSVTWRMCSDTPLVWLSGGTFGILAVQLVNAIAGGNGLCNCDGCGRIYVREGRRPQVGRNNFCPDCGPRVAARLRQRKRRARITAKE